MLLDDMVDYLTSGNVGTTANIFAGFRPDAPETLLAVYETGGLGTVHAMNPAAGQAVLERPRVQVVCRGGQYDYAAARQMMHQAFVLLDGLPRRTINGTQYYWGRSVQSPFGMGRDEAGRVLIACNFDIAKALST